MAFNPHVVKMNRVKDANAREKRRLENQIRGHAGIESQQKYNFRFNKSITAEIQ